MSSRSRYLVPKGKRYTYEYFFLDCVCRLCWSAEGIVELTSFSPKTVSEDVSVAEKIQESVGIDVTTLSHPQKICLKCMNKVDMFIEFKRFCLETDKKLHKIFEKGSAHAKLQRTGIRRKRKLNKLIVKQESDVDISNLKLEHDVEDSLEDPLSCEIKNKKLPVRKKVIRENYCNSCQLNLESGEKFKEHNIEYHGLEENGLYKCFGCEKRFDHLKKRLRHESEFCKALKCGYKCSICSRYLAKRRIYEDHMRAHRENPGTDLPDNLYNCNKCSKSFESPEILRAHNKLAHFRKEKRTYVCDTCGRVFTRQDYLYKHKLVHKGVKYHKCPHCDYKSVQKTSLTIHIRKHTGERPYPCDMCPHRCVTSSNLGKHRRQHLGIKRFECKLCDKKFGYKLSLEEHVSSVHAHSERHMCSKCGATYSRFRGLRRHFLSKHGKKIKKTKDELIEVENTQDKNVNGASIQNSQSQMEVPNSQMDQNCEIVVPNSQIEVQKQ